MLSFTSFWVISGFKRLLYEGQCECDITNLLQDSWINVSPRSLFCFVCNSQSSHKSNCCRFCYFRFISLSHFYPTEVTSITNGIRRTRIELGYSELLNDTSTVKTKLQNVMEKVLFNFVRSFKTCFFFILKTLIKISK